MIFLRRVLYNIVKTFRPNKSRTIVYTFSVLLLAVGALMASVLSSSTESYIRISSSNSQIAAGQPFRLDVYAGASVPVNAVDIRVKFPKDKVTVKKINTGASVLTIWTKDPYVDGDAIVLQGGTFRRGFVGEHLVASVDMIAKETGEAVFAVSELVLLAGDGTGRPVPTKDISKDNLVVSVSATQDGLLDATIEVKIASDIDGDGQVTFADIKNFMDAWGVSDLRYDFNADNKVNFTDFAIILAQSFMF